MDKKGQLDFEVIIAFIFLVMVFIFFAPFFVKVGTGNYEGALNSLISIIVPLMFLGLIIDLLRRIFT